MTDRSDRVCPSCRIRHRVPAPAFARDYYSSVNVERQVIHFLYQAAVFFDVNADEPHTAREFVDWLLPDLRGGSSIGPDHDGEGSVTELPVVPEWLRRRVS